MQEPSEQGPLLSQCPECQQSVDVSGLPPFVTIECPACGASMKARSQMGQYQIMGVLGEGGMSQVFKAVDMHLGREVALKVLHQSLSSDSALTAMFEREAKLTASILHPNVVKVFTVGKEAGYFFIAMELVEATSLEQMIAERGGIPEKDVLHIAHDVVAGLKAAHQESLIHRDIKPGNMLVTGEGTAKLVDFGLAVQQGGDDESEDLWATPYYVPPEKLEGELDTYRGDIYSLGATLYHALAGSPPFEANTSSLDELKEIKKNEVDLKAAAPATSKATLKLIQRMMAYAPEARPDSYERLLEDIIAIEKRSFGFDRSSRGGSEKRKQPWLVVGTLSALLAVGVAISVYRSGGGAGGGGGVDLGGGNDVISAGADSNAAMFLQGRELMVSGDFRKAKGIFEQLTGVTSLSPSTQMWNGFFNGTLDLILGNEKESREAFSRIQAIEENGEEGVEDVVRFLKKMSGPLSDALPVYAGEVPLDPGSVEAVGLFVSGMKNWHLGSFKSGMSLLEEFAASSPPSNYKWIEQLKSNVDLYRRDYERLNSLPNPSRQSERSVRTAQVKELETALAEIETRGALQRLINERIKRVGEIDELIAQEKEGLANTPLAQKVSPEPKPVEKPVIPEAVTNQGPMDPFADETLSEAERAEKQQLIQVLGTLVGYGETLEFSEAAAKLQAVPIESWTIQELRQELIYSFSRANEFLKMLSDQFAIMDYSGIVRRREGVPLDAAITAATPEVFVVDLGFGPNDVGVTEFDPGWMIEAAEEVLPPPSPATQVAWEQVVFFALATQQNEAAARLSKPLAESSPEFSERWKKLMSLSNPDL